MHADSRTSTSDSSVENKSALGFTTTTPRRRSVRFTLSLIFLLIVSVVMAMATKPARATDFDALSILSPNQFETLIENIGAATHYKAIAPAEPLGLIGFDIAIELSATELDDDLFDIAAGGDFGVSQFFLPRLHVHKGLPFGIDIGGSIAAIPETDFQVIGAEVRYAILRGSILTPAVALRGTYSFTTGVDELDVTNAGLELSISKGFAFLTPYAGLGIIRTTGDPGSGVAQSEESVNLEKTYVGININLGFNLGFEIDRTGDFTTFSGKAGIRF